MMQMILGAVLLTASFVVNATEPTEFDGPDPDDIEYMQMDQMLYTVVKLEGVLSSVIGSGVVVAVDDEYSYIVTAKHVVTSAKHFVVQFFPSRERHTSELLAMAKTLDIALIRARYVNKYVAKLAKRTPKVFKEVINIGAGLGQDPHPTTGIVSLIEDSRGFMQTSASVVDGMSGGGTFTKVKGEYVYVGVISALASAPSHRLNSETGEEDHTVRDSMVMERINHMALTTPVRHVKLMLLRARSQGLLP